MVWGKLRLQFSTFSFFKVHSSKLHSSDPLSLMAVRVGRSSQSLKSKTNPTDESVSHSLDDREQIDKILLKHKMLGEHETFAI